MADNICGAKTRSGKSCQNKPIAGKKRCRLHGGLSPGAPKGNKNRQTHGIYSRIFDDAQIDDAIAMQGNVSRELAIARIQLANLLAYRKTQEDTPALAEIKDETLADEEDEETVKKARARDAARCGEYYDPNEDDYGGQESEPLKRTRVYKTRDWASEEARLINLIAKLEYQIPKQAAVMLELETRKKELERNPVGGAKTKDLESMTDEELDEYALGLLSGKP
ncbi:HGGxSTG domain-containing protein [Psychrobacter sp. Marseille-P5312]|uniref:HGGxSTG domain-containing protein n=1 Tax=Psychrobacter sp. Marseille-P5312 TaxID=2086574 RepID=UPI000CF664E9|nr:HGGxSTG domain-containing protein [Psychrobacter sp. Marseille-P5312]